MKFSQRKECKLVRFCERVGLNTAPLAFSKPQLIRINVEYVKRLVRY